jgi:hypothetical protein
VNALDTGGTTNSPDVPSLGAAVDALGPLPTATTQVLAHGLVVALGAIHEMGWYIATSSRRTCCSTPTIRA